MIKKYLDCSTAHVPWNEWSRMYLEREKGCAGLIFSEHSYGRWVWVASDDYDSDELREKLPQLVKVVDYARRSDCAWINFDQDADVVEGLPIFDW